jgi:AcrR family transcriptional regulator
MSDAATGTTSTRAATAPRRTRLEHEERREQILACARRLFSERHYGAVSAAEIAREAGVARGLLHHYFGGKRGLYLEVVRSMFELPTDLFDADATADKPEAALGAAVDRWLEMASRNRSTWLAVAGAQGFGRDPEIEAIVDEARDRIADRVIEILQPGVRGKGSRELRALVMAYSGFVQAATLDWLERRRINRAQVRTLLVHGLLELHRRVLPRVERA